MGSGCEVGFLDFILQSRFQGGIVDQFSPVTPFFCLDRLSATVARVGKRCATTPE
jgi:hypothetical protein